MGLVENIEKRIKESEKQAEEEVNQAEIFEKDAVSLEKNEVWDKSGKKYHDAASSFRYACINLGAINLWITGLKGGALEQLRLRETDERYINLHKRIKECHKKSADLYKKASDIFSKFPNKYLRADLLGMAAREYCHVLELSSEEELKIQLEPGKVYDFSETSVGVIVDVYRTAANLFNEIGIEFEESGKKSKAYIFYGYMGDAYLSIALVREEDKHWPFGNVSDQADNYLGAAEAYYKSGKLSKEVGVSSVVMYARIEWKHAQRRIFDFFKDNKGYTTSHDLKRASLAFKKARLLFDKVGLRKQSEYCSQRIKEIERALEPIRPQIPVKPPPKGASVTGFPWADTEYSRVMSEVADSIHQNDLESYEIVVASLLNYMGQNLVDNFFKGAEYDEKSFHQDLSKLLKRDPRIGAGALNEVYTGGGRVDILVRGVPVELKAEKGISDTKKVIDRHAPQASQYASSKGKQVGILCVLDLTKKTKPIPCPSNDIHVAEVPVHGHDTGNPLFPSIIISMVIRGNLPTPSGLS